MDYNETRISKLRTYLFSIIDTLTTDKNYQINADMLDNDINNYSLNKIPTSSTIEEDIVGTITYRDVFSLKSRKAYSQDVINNLHNIGFFESFEALIKSNNQKGVLPDIQGIQSIKCLNPGTMLGADTNTAEFDIQIEIKYEEEY